MERVTWRRGFTEVDYRSSIDNQESKLRCRQVIVTVSLGVLQGAPPSPGVIQFDPEPSAILRAARSLEFGLVYRITFRLRSAFWEDDENLKQLGFLVSNDKQFFTWWTTLPVMTPLLIAWCAGWAADRFRSSDQSVIVDGALASLARMLKRKIPRPDEIYFHDWHRDPFFRGAYSYVPVNGLRARETLAKPVDGTLFFAGEATELKGHSATVHGAMASGVRAATLAMA